MMKPEMIYALPTWLIALVTVGLALLGGMACELLARQLFPIDHRRAHNDVAAAMFSVIGVTFAVLLAFVTMISLENYDSARTAIASEATAARDVLTATKSLPASLATRIQTDIATYLHTIVDDEWPAQAAGQPIPLYAPTLDDLSTASASFEPTTSGSANRQATLMAATARLQDARATRLQAARYGIADLVWLVVFVGGALTVISGSFLGAPRTAWHVAMSATLAASGGIVIFLIIVLAQPLRGDHALPPTPYSELIADMRR